MILIMQGSLMFYSCSILISDWIPFKIVAEFVSRGVFYFFTTIMILLALLIV